MCIKINAMRACTHVLNVGSFFKKNLDRLSLFSLMEGSRSGENLKVVRGSLWSEFMNIRFDIILLFLKPVLNKAMKLHGRSKSR